MKKLLAFLLLCLPFFGISQTSHVVTFKVNTANITVGSNGLYLGGGVIGGANAVQLTDTDGNGVYEGTDTLSGTAGGNFIFLNSPSWSGDWAAKENLTGLACADASNYNDRILPTFTQDTTLMFCYGTCATDTVCPVTATNPDVTFRVDMSNVSASFTNVYVSGTLNSWSGNANQLTDADGDGIYEGDISLAAGNYEFKFTYDNWVGQESLDATLDSACTLTTGTFTNRYITIGASDTTLPVYCWEECSSCATSYTPTACGDLFFSEYAEGSSNNKYFEIYNPTAGSINLANYEVHLFSNGGTTASQVLDFPSGKTLASGDVYVVSNSGSDTSILAFADTSSTTTYFNGNDALVLLKNTDTLDILGEVGVNSYWTAGSGSMSNNTLIRKSNVDMGTTDWTQSSSQWDVYPSNTWTYGGAHASNCIVTPKNVTFQVDMNNVTTSFTNVYVSGTINNWSGNANQLTDADGDGVYEGTLSLLPGSYEYKFTYDNWTGQESLNATLDSACTLTTGSFTNRYATFGNADTTLPVVCWEDCAACAGPTDFAVTFMVNTANITVGTNGLYLGGGVIGGANAVQLLDPDGDGIYVGTDTLNGSNGGNFIFLNSPANASDWNAKENLAGLSCADPSNYNDRILPTFTQDTTLMFCYGTCSTDTSCTVTSTNPDVTFRVDMSNVSASFTNVYVSGTLNSWSGNANQLTDPDGDGVYEADISLAAGNYEFKFTYDNWVGQESLDATLDSACTLTTGAFTNRYITIGASDTTLPVFCWEECTSCAPALPQVCGTINLELYDSYGDGWNGAEIDVEFTGGDSTYTLSSGSYVSIPLSINYLDTANFVWAADGSYPSECTFKITDASGTVLYSSPTGSVMTVGTAQYTTYCATAPLPQVCGTINLELYDSYGDGWNGAEIDVEFTGGDSTYTLSSGSYVSIPLSVNYLDTANFVWAADGSYPSECTYKITDSSGTVLYSSPTGSVMTVGTTQYTTYCATLPLPQVCGELFFSEYSEGSSNNKYIEIYNPTANAVSLSTYTVYQSGNGGSFTNTFTTNATLASGDVYMIATNQADASIQAVADTVLAFPSIAHFNGDDAMILVSGTDTVDVIGVPGVDPGSSWTVGTGSTANHTLVRMASIGAGSTDWTTGATEWDVYAQNTWTYMGAHTSNCIYVAPAPTFDSVVAINTITGVDASGVADSLGTMKWIKGIVTSIDFDGNGGYSFYVTDGTDGINIYNFADQSGYTTPMMGDSLFLHGEVDQFNGLTELFVDSIYLANSGNTLPAPAVVTALDESTESELIQLVGFTLADATQWPASGSANVDITNGTDTMTMRIDSDTDIDGSTAPAGTFDVTGIGSQFDSSSPYDEGYQIFPRQLTDIFVYPFIPTYTIDQVDNTDADGVPDSLNVYCKVVGVVHGVDMQGSATAVSFTVHDGTEGLGTYSSVATVASYVVTEGDEVRIVGSIGHFNGLLQMYVDSITVLSTGNATQTPTVVTALGESTESELVKFENMTMVDPTQWGSGSSGYNIDITNGSDTIVMRIDADVDLYGAPAPTGMFDVVGIGGQFDFSAPHFDGYQLLPRYQADIMTSTGVAAVKLSISEIMAGSNSTAYNADWFEIYNYGDSAVDLSGYSWDDESEIAGTSTFPSVTVQPGEAIVVLDDVAANKDAFLAEWKLYAGSVTIVANDELTGSFPSLSQNGDAVFLYDANGAEMASGVYTAATAGFAVEFDTTGTFTGDAVDGTNGAYTSLEGDVGSPGNLTPNTGVDEAAVIANIYPNPTTGSFTVNFASAMSYQATITTMTGATVFQKEGTGAILNIDLNAARGTYVLRVRTAQGTAVQMIVLQ
ncbi:lamin tail domain-containing protein [Schleiferiaceae bacterium]|nr:lamin tail domain-containing protein [Schleiferiaceae bacterium]